ncbi:MULTISPECIES: peptidase inhibitor family I36 protein [unclassified Streptomyces]|uniref:peptidase inhibitor family I36 protein n=1 Tax=unclassified Streptomyces TaxID=2593676 RepID=UPI002DDA0909|nr:MULTISPECIES: peptidase inhibitor family I36 protein [unclassified Streptomyces]WSF85556.1 peptidase inhibitor family I36 protein [Streptomyces sp. NBC_01744]WSC38154.1 peptidase inhibitor family I36 protein [Streptomyces sp. NBC_01763]WSC46278.1 peptidase inhibitor family I36 protein [Streptomyces sp. NBC_01762]WSC54719.1 peptidase inhibitor family I36 protein [Streptomyces sp. NBC_01761]WSD25932.1 peptidase inhibitor family I36 protein [Streptomyces sp. NBC_01751]
MGITTGKRFAGAALAIAAAAGITLGTAGQALAAEKNGVLDSGEIGLFYNSGQSGCVFDLAYADTNFSGDVFKGGSCSGSGQSVNDNTASYWNQDVYTWWVYTDANAGGIEGSVPADYFGNASSNFKNEISSAYWYKAR